MEGLGTKIGVVCAGRGTTLGCFEAGNGGQRTNERATADHGWQAMGAALYGKKGRQTDLGKGTLNTTSRSGLYSSGSEAVGGVFLFQRGSAYDFVTMRGLLER